MARTIALRFATTCIECSRSIGVGSYAYYGGKGKGARCPQCGPFPLPEVTFTTTVLPDGRAEGAMGHVDGLRPMMSKSMARSIAMSNGGPGRTSSAVGPKRKRNRRSRRPKPP